MKRYSNRTSIVLSDAEPILHEPWLENLSGRGLKKREESYSVAGSAFLLPVLCLFVLFVAIAFPPSRGECISSFLYAIRRCENRSRMLEQYIANAPGMDKMTTHFWRPVCALAEKSGTSAIALSNNRPIVGRNPWSLRCAGLICARPTADEAIHRLRRFHRFERRAEPLYPIIDLRRVLIASPLHLRNLRNLWISFCLTGRFGFRTARVYYESVRWPTVRRSAKRCRLLTAGFWFQAAVYCSEGPIMRAHLHVPAVAVAILLPSLIGGSITARGAERSAKPSAGNSKGGNSKDSNPKDTERRGGNGRTGSRGRGRWAAGRTHGAA